MEKAIADLGILFASALICVYMLWDKLFPES